MAFLAAGYVAYSSYPDLAQTSVLSEAQVKRTPMELREAIGIVTRVCNLRMFRSRIFPKLCFRQSLALYRTLNQMGYPVEIHFGVKKDDKIFRVIAG